MTLIQPKPLAGKTIVWAILSWSTLSLIIPIQQSLTSMDYINIVPDQVHPFIATVFPAGDGGHQ